MSSKRLTFLVLLLIGLVAMGCQSEEAAPTAVPPTRTTIATAVPPSTPKIEATKAPTATAVASPEPFVPIFAEAPCFFDVPADVVEGEDVICGFVTVPEDHNQTDGPTIKIAVAIAKDHSEDHQPDPVFILAGGPGQKLLKDALLVAPILEPVHPDRDLVLFDQRGVGFSEPALECPEFPAAILINLPLTDRTERAENIFNSIMACRDRLVAEGHNLAAYNTWQNAADVEMIRTALGYEEINLYGGSYGSLLAQAVMRDHPDALRSVIIDSVYPLEVSFFVDVSTVSSAAIMHLMEACAADEACNAAFPNLAETLFTVIDELNAEPVSVTLTHPSSGETYEAFLTGEDVVGNLRTFLYETLAIPMLPQTIADVAEGDYALMTRLSSAKLASLDTLTNGMEFSVLCTEDLIGRTPQDFLDNLASLPPQLAGPGAPEEFLAYGIFAVCRAWPVTEMDEWVKEPVVSNIPTLILSGEFDPVTPSEYADLAAAHLSQSYVYEFPGVGHSPIGGSACVRQMVGEFVQDPSLAPDDSCIAELGIDFAVPADYDVSNREPVFIEEYGVSSVVPAGWSEIEPGVFGSPDLSQLLYIIVVEAELESFMAENGLIGPVDELEVNGRVWQMYEFQPPDPHTIGLDLLTPRDGGGHYDIAIITPEDQLEDLKADVLLPALEAFTEGETAVALEAIKDDAFGISGLAPTGWTEIAPGVFARGENANDLTTLIQKSYAGLTTDDLLGALLPQLGLETLPESVGQIETDTFVWELYLVEVESPLGVVKIDIALTEANGIPYMVLMQLLADDYDLLHEAVFLPAVEAFSLTH